MTREACACEDRSCVTCKRPMRAFNQLKAHHPETVSVGARGKCASCTDRERAGLTGPASPRGSSRKGASAGTPRPRRSKAKVPHPGTEWMADAACIQVDPEAFFAPDGERGGARMERFEEALQVCRTCPVLTLCDQLVAATRPQYGVWAGRIMPADAKSLAAQKAGAA